MARELIIVIEVSTPEGEQTLNDLEARLKSAEAGIDAAKLAGLEQLAVGCGVKIKPHIGSGKMSPRACADVLGVSPDYIVGEIHDGRLPAHEREFEGTTRKRYRVAASDFAAYIEKYWPRKDRRQIPRTNVT